MDKILLLFALPAAGIAIAIGIAVIGWLRYGSGQQHIARLQSLKLRIRVPERILWALLGGLFVLGQAAVTHASTPTPIPPTSTPVPLDIPINIVMSSTNGWINTFAPIAAIGIGIAVALAILGYLGKMIKGAFS